MSQRIVLKFGLMVITSSFINPYSRQMWQFHSQASVFFINPLHPKCMTGCAPDFLFSKYIQRATITKQLQRGTPSHAKYSFVKTTIGQRTFYFKTVKLWNSLDSTLKLKPTLKYVKHCLKRSLTSDFLDNWLLLSLLFN